MKGCKAQSMNLAEHAYPSHSRGSVRRIRSVRIHSAVGIDTTHQNLDTHHARVSTDPSPMLLHEPGLCSVATHDPSRRRIPTSSPARTLCALRWTVSNAGGQTLALKPNGDRTDTVKKKRSMDSTADGRGHDPDLSPRGRSRAVDRRRDGHRWHQPSDPGPDPVPAGNRSPCPAGTVPPSATGPRSPPGPRRARGDRSP